MKDNIMEEKRLELADLNHRYTEMGEKLYAMEKELGYVDEEIERLRAELESLLGSEFFVFQIDAVKHPCREDYIIHIERKLPIEKETGKPENNYELGDHLGASGS